MADSNFNVGNAEAHGPGAVAVGPGGTYRVGADPPPPLIERVRQFKRPDKSVKLSSEETFEAGGVVFAIFLGLVGLGMIVPFASGGGGPVGAAWVLFGIVFILVAFGVVAKTVEFHTAEVAEIEAGIHTIRPIIVDERTAFRITLLLADGSMRTYSTGLQVANKAKEGDVGVAYIKQDSVVVFQFVDGTDTRDTPVVVAPPPRCG